MIIVSACLLGQNCKYNGQNNRNEAVLTYLQDQEFLVVCPESLGGLPIPRPPAEMKNGRVLNAQGEDVSRQFFWGAQQVLQIALANKAAMAILKENSPSCGVHAIYDGSFQKKAIRGSGICTKLLKEAGIPVYSEEDITRLMAGKDDKND